MRSRTKIHGVASGLALLAALGTSTVLAQVLPRRAAPGEQPRVIQGQPGQQRVTANRPQTPSSPNIDRQIANLLTICNQEEVELGRMASSKAKNEEVRKFAENIAKEHNNLVTQLQQFGATAVALRYGRDDARQGVAEDRTPQNSEPAAPAANANRDDRRVAQPNRPDAQTRTADSTPGGLDFLAVHRQIAEKCLADAEQSWSENKDCDMAYVGQQIGAHKQMLHAQQVLREHASPELQVVIDKGIQSTEDHLAHAKDLIRKLEKEEKSKD